jgi:phage/plasmid primase-like uncharacterized protein
MPIDANAVALARATRIEDEIARRGIRLRGKVERVGPCATCGGTDRFSINTRKQVWNCRVCEKGGDVIDLVRHLDHCDFATAVRTLAGIEPGRPTPKVDPARLAEARANAERAKIDELAKTAERFKDAMTIWSEAVPIENTLAKHYLRVARKLDVPDGVSGQVLRFHPDCPFGNARYPCMIALVRSIITDEPQAIVRTALRTDGTALRIDGKTARKALGPIGGGAIKLSDNAEVATGLTVGEGVETVLVSMALPTWCRPAWALIDCGNLVRFPVLAGIESLIILVDHDRPDRHGRRAGQSAAAECARRWEAAGREVIAVMPRREGDDMADIDFAA